MRLLKLILLMTLVWSYSPSQAQIDDDLNFIERFKQKRASRKAKRQAKADYKEWERNYKQQQRDHYNRQNENTKKMMRRGQKQAERQANRRTHSWWWRLRNRL